MTSGNARLGSKSTLKLGTCRKLVKDDGLSSRVRILQPLDSRLLRFPGRWDKKGIRTYCLWCCVCIKRRIPLEPQKNRS